MRIFVFLCTLQASVFGAEIIRPSEALEMLVKGNQRFVEERSTHADRTAERRLETADGQSPFAIILGCSDSRVAPEIIFDQGIGDLFIVRVAGNVVGPIEQDSIEYAALYLNSTVLMVLGHENCGAVKAVMAGTTKDIESVAELIEPAVIETRGCQGDLLQKTIVANVSNVVSQLRKSPVLKKLIDQKKLSVVGGYYNFHTGKVELLK